MIEFTLRGAEGVPTYLRNLDKAGQAAARIGMARVSIRGKEHALELINTLIYNTPQRGGYIRTGALRRSIEFYVRGNQYSTSIYAVAGRDLIRPYAKFNEQGTRESHVSAEDILAQARSTVGELILLEYGRGRGGLEPRPFMYPTLIFMERILPEEVYAALQRNMPKGGDG